MKANLLTLASCVALLAGPALSARAPRVDYQDLVNKVKQAEQAFKDAKPVKSAFEDIKSQLPTFDDAEQVKRERLERALDDLIERAKNAQIILEDFWRLQAMIIDAKCCTEVRILWKQAKNRDATRRQFEYVATLLEERAAAAKEHPDLRQMVQEQIDKLMKKYLGGENLSEPEMLIFDDEMVRSLLDRALAWLEDMAVSRHATREQFLYVKDLMTDRARKFSEDAEWRALMERVNAELERLMNRDLATAGFGRDDFLKLREMCMTKARAAMTGTPGN
jgi:hypothetical protein